ncbi:VOC family protein [Paenibacillus sp.]|uniref:VOC family protein n=1 Tax=Paenibacillus sp. TaxID=58172 RepID=UPI002D484670|nr:VOC family protein [Paenibacillus sp.]HZG85486.1 VOC family protein [Paenibacillus sp.]
MPANIQSIFVNLPVKDLKKSIEFFSRVGFTFDERFTDDNATCMIIGPNMYAMLLNTSFFGTFTEKEIVDASKSAETIVALSVGSREEVDDIANKALEAGGSPSKEAADHGFMYTRSFQDVDGHIWEVFHMDMSAFPQE